MTSFKAIFFFFFFSNSVRSVFAQSHSWIRVEAKHCVILLSDFKNAFKFKSVHAFAALT